MSASTVVLILLSTFMHAGWNLLAHHRRSNATLFLQLLIVIGFVGIGPVLASQWLGQPFPPVVWALALLSGLFLCLYYLGLTLSYRSGEFGLVYPIVRAAPVLMLAGVDVARGYFPSVAGWSGLALVCTGCLLMPQESFTRLAFHRYFNRTIGWVFLSAIGTAGYTTVDKAASGYFPTQGPLMAAQYGVLQFLFTVPFLWMALHFIDATPNLRIDLRQWFWPAVAAALTYGAYWLILCAYQLTAFTSYVVALRQFSVALGAVGAVLIFKERLWLARILGLILLTAGVVIVSVFT